MKQIVSRCVLCLLVCAPLVEAAEPARILTNHVGYDPFGPKRAVIQSGGSDRVTACAVRTYPSEKLAYEGAVGAAAPVPAWRDWRFSTFDFSGVEREGEYFIECRNNGWDSGRTLRSFPFKIQKNVLERATLSNVVAYFKAQRATGEFERAARTTPFSDPARPRIDARGGWYDATGDYGIHFSQLSFSSYFNTQQVPLTAYALARSYEMLDARGDKNFTQIKRKLVDEATYGADFLVRMHRPGRSFYETINGFGPGKKAEDRHIGAAMLISPEARKTAPEDQRDGKYEVSYRSGGGFAIAALATAARLPQPGDFNRDDYLKAAEEAFAFLEANNKEALNDGVENIVDDYCALAGAAELLRTTKKPIYAAAAQRRADSLISRLTATEKYKDFWRADAKDRPFFNPSDAGAPVVTLLSYYDLADEQTRARIKDAVKRSLTFEIAVTNEVTNPFGLARQYVQSKGKGRRTEFFFPHDTETGAWWQGENARLGSLATAARLAAPLFTNDPAFTSKLESYAQDQLNWILGLNPFDMSMLHGSGRNNPEYMFLGTWQYTQFPGGIVNGVTSGYKDDTGLDFNVPYEVTQQDHDWRWGEQWLPHSTWYLLALSAAPSAPTNAKAVIGYIFVMDGKIDPKSVPAEKLTHINYAFANIADGVMVEGFKNDARNYATLNGLKKRNPALKIMVSVGGWTWSGNFSDMSLTHESRKRFIDSAVAFLRRHQLDGLDVDWEYPGQVGYGNIHRPEDRENFTALMAEARAALDVAGGVDGKRYLLTFAAGANDAWIEHTEMDKVQASIDFVNLMTYDQFEAEIDPTTGHHAPLYTHPANPKKLSAALIVNHFIAAGVPASKIVLGVPFYGRSWGNASVVENGVYQPATPPNVRLPIGYRDLKTLPVRDGFVRGWDEISAVPYLYNENRRLFISYDDVESIRLKSRYVLDRGLGGVMFWELSSDDGDLLTTIDATLKGQ